MKDKLKNDASPNGFHYPRQYETMSVATAFGYLDLAKDHHGYLFTPDNYFGFKALLVLKCGVDIDWVFSNSFVEDINEVEKHITKSKLPPEELEKEVEKRIMEQQQNEEKNNLDTTTSKKR